jgi:hypothetical protein
LPLCEECNRDFGAQLEGPMSRLLDEIERGDGLSDDDAELAIRWMWKLKGLGWHALHPRTLSSKARYSQQYTLRERVLLPIDAIRPHLIIGVAVIANRDKDFADLPMGANAVTEHDAIFMSGVFSMTAMMVVLDQFASMMPPEFARYQLAPQRRPEHSGKLLYPPTTFSTGVEAVGVTALASLALSRAHDEFALALIGRGSVHPSG